MDKMGRVIKKILLSLVWKERVPSVLPEEGESGDLFSLPEESDVLLPLPEEEWEVVPT